VGGQGVALIGINDRADNTTQRATVQTAFPAGTVLVDYSRQMPPVTVRNDRQVTIVVPSNNDPSDDPPGGIRFDNNGRGFVLYAPRNPQSPSDGSPAVIIEQEGVALSLQSFPTADGRFGDPEPNTQVQAPVVRRNAVTLRLRTDGTARSAVVQIDGQPLALAGRSVISDSPEGLADGFVQADPVGGGEFVLSEVDLAGLNEGWHVVRFLAFSAPVEAVPPIFNTFTQVFILDRPERSRHVTDGKIIGDFNFPPIARQTVEPGDGAIDGLTELDALFVEADAENLYIGVSGNVLGPFGSGIAIFIDVDFGAGTGLRNFGQLDDDSGPATRLLSNTEVTAPVEGFGAEFAVATVGGAGLSSAPLAPIRSGAAMPPPVGALAGAYRIALADLRDLIELSAEMAFDPDHIANRGPAPVNPRTGAVSDGLEVAIPLAALFPDGVIPAGARLAVFAYITDPGETGEITRPDSEDRIRFGGRPPGEAFVTNQILFGVVPERNTKR